MIAFSTTPNRWAIVSIIGVLLLSFACLNAPANTTALPENRFLLIVETSNAMEKRAAGLAAALDQLLHSGMEGQAKPGDTIGIWTYNNSLSAGAFPLQTWSRDAGKPMAAGALAFMADQKLSKRPRFDCVAQALEPVVKDSPFITVIIICSGTDPIKGTAFDKEINRSMASWRDEVQKAHMPLVIVLTAAHGLFTHFSVTPAAWRIEMPPLPSELVAQPKPRKPVASPQAAAPKIASVPNLIVSGKRSAPPAAPSPTAPAIPATNASVILSNPEPSRLATAPSEPVASLTTNLSSAAPAPPAAALADAAPVPSPYTVVTQVNPAVSPSSPALSPSAPEPSSTLNDAVAAFAPRARDAAVIRKRLILGGIVVAAIFVVVLLRRSRRGHVSLITHSIDSERE